MNFLRESLKFTSLKNIGKLVNQRRTVTSVQVMTNPFSFSTSWTHKLDSERLEEHDFNNLIQEFRYAVERQDRMMMVYCEGELKRMYQERRRH
jgi:hypothetical protein